MPSFRYIFHSPCHADGDVGSGTQPSQGWSSRQTRRRKRCSLTSERFFMLPPPFVKWSTTWSLVNFYSESSCDWLLTHTQGLFSRHGLHAVHHQCCGCGIHEASAYRTCRVQDRPGMHVCVCMYVQPRRTVPNPFLAINHTNISCKQIPQSPCIAASLRNFLFEKRKLSPPVSSLSFSHGCMHPHNSLSTYLVCPCNFYRAN